MYKNYILLFALCSIIIGYSQTTQIPDPNFEQLLIDRNIDSDGIINGQVLTADISGITTLNIDGNTDISDLTGIEDFVSLQALSAMNTTQLISLDVSNNVNLTNLNAQNSTSLSSVNLNGAINLEILNLSSTAITTIDVSTNINLEFLTLINLRMTSLDVSNNINLFDLNLFLSDFTSLDLSNNVDLGRLNIRGNEIADLDLSNNSNLGNLNAIDAGLSSLNLRNGNNTRLRDSALSLTSNPNLTCVQVDDATFSTNTWTRIGSQTFFAEVCSNTITLIPDSNFEQALIDQNIDSDGVINGQVNTPDISGLTTLLINNLNISDLTGIQDFVNLVILSATSNNLSNIDLSSNTNLENLNLSSNSLTNIDLSSNTELRLLIIADNNITDLDLTVNNELTNVDIRSNDLNRVNIQNGNNTAIGTNFLSSSNPNLLCVQVDDVTFSTTNWTVIDTVTVFSTDCDATLSTNDFELSVVNIFPNPTSTTINIDLPPNIILEEITIYNNLGQFVSTTNTTRVDMSNLNAGLYFMEIKTDRGRTTRKIIKE